MHPHADPIFQIYGLCAVSCTAFNNVRIHRCDQDHNISSRGQVCMRSATHKNNKETWRVSDKRVQRIYFSCQAHRRRSCKCNRVLSPVNAFNGDTRGDNAQAIFFSGSIFLFLTAETALMRNRGTQTSRPRDILCLFLRGNGAPESREKDIRERRTVPTVE